MIDIEYTDNSCVLYGHSRPGIPLLVNNEGFITPACDFLRYRIIKESISITSAKTYAEDLQNFFSFIERNNIKWQKVTDNHLLIWRDWQKVGSQTKNRRLATVFAMYVWLETEGHIKYVVKIPSFNDHEDFTPQLTGRQPKIFNHRSKRRHNTFVSTLHITSATSAMAPVPTDDDIAKIYAEIDNPDPSVAKRNYLLIRWYREVALRRFEFASITENQIPSLEEIYKLEESNSLHEISIIGKNKLRRVVSVAPDLLLSTREYLDLYRTELIERFKTKNKKYNPPKEAFLSSKTGQVIGLTSISNLIKNLMKKADVNAWGHRIRASSLTALFESEYQAAKEEKLRLNSKEPIDFEFILIRVAERAGHKNKESLRHYLNIIKKREAKRNKVDDNVTNLIDAKILKIEIKTMRQKQQEEYSKMQTLLDTGKLDELAEFIATKNNAAYERKE